VLLMLVVLVMVMMMTMVMLVMMVMMMIMNYGDEFHDDFFHRMPRHLCLSDSSPVAAAPTTRRPRSYPAICKPKFPSVFPQT
jgi:hypothetical protein